MVREFSVKRDGLSHKLSAHFILAEFQCTDGNDKVLVSDELLVLLEQIRTWAREVIPGCIVIITSGYRTKAYNASPAVKGAVDSQHLYGTAADIKIRTPDGHFVKPATIAHAMEAGEVTGKPFHGGLGVYPRADLSKAWTHVDVRFKNARWKG